MDDKDQMKFADIKRIVGEHLKTAIGVEQFTIGYAKHTEGQWKVNVEYQENIEGILFPTSVAMVLNDQTGEVEEFLKGRAWSF